MNHKILSIAVPTYNGASTIVQTIESILNQFQEINTNSIEILIIDNASNDEVWQIACGYKRKYPSLFSIFSNAMNVGYDRNVDFLFKKSIGNFVWPLADDDIILPGGLKKVMDVLVKYPDVSLIFVGGARNINVNNEICFNGNNFLKDTEFRSGGVSANIIRRETWISLDVAKYFDSGWIHFGAVIEVAFKGKAYIFKDVLIAEPLGLEKRWGGSGKFLLLGLDLIKVFKHMKVLGYNCSSIRNAHLLIRKNYYLQIVKAKAQGLKINVSIIIRFAKLYYSFPSFWLVDFPLLLIPQRLCTIIYKIKKYETTR